MHNEFSSQEVTPEPVEQTIAHMWITSVLRGAHRKSHVIPDRVVWLPCGCTRENGFEADINNRWKALQRDRELVHAECMRTIGSAATGH